MSLCPEPGCWHPAGTACTMAGCPGRKPSPSGMNSAAATGRVGVSGLGPSFSARRDDSRHGFGADVSSFHEG